MKERDPKHPGYINLLPMWARQIPHPDGNPKLSVFANDTAASLGLVFEGDTIANPVEYQDSLGFARVANAMIEVMTPTMMVHSSTMPKVRHQLRLVSCQDRTKAPMMPLRSITTTAGASISLTPIQILRKVRARMIPTMIHTEVTPSWSARSSTARGRPTDGCGTRPDRPAVRSSRSDSRSSSPRPGPRPKPAPPSGAPIRVTGAQSLVRSLEAVGCEVVFGIPGDSITAIVIGVLYMKNLAPGPMIFTNSPVEMYSVFIVFILANIIMLPLGYLAVKLAKTVLSVPTNILMPMILLFCIVGTFAINNSVFDVVVMLGVGLLAYFMEENDIPIAPAVLGVVLGGMLEENFIFSMIKADGDFLMFFREMRLAVRFATQPFANSIRALAMSGVSLITETPLAWIFFTSDFTTLRMISISWIMRSSTTGTSVPRGLNSASL